MFHVALIRTARDYFVLLNHDRSICGFISIEAGRDSFEGMYMDSHRRSYEGSMSACINHITFQPAFISIESLDEIYRWVADPERMKVCSVSNVSGHFVGLLLDSTKAASVWERGAKPKLYS
jgi:hypothetical protein